MSMRNKKQKKPLKKRIKLLKQDLKDIGKVMLYAPFYSVFIAALLFEIIEYQLIFNKDDKQK